MNRESEREREWKKGERERGWKEERNETEDTNCQSSINSLRLRREKERDRGRDGGREIEKKK